eukprot:CAMPEP_0206244066 /NCGR_PEP_ID=MMETSP0047_2-20121206/17950_1 /ASSEMBLY_ACC=CAM_ASM_000192 /TAXON_ID=195065 /ORGANISM="Chroomonas mesostigmatica_cf, Strain CCMP1168" /LENGTH=374 /DNA_ID=CAMNT_0053669243 /DNA_START=125 /DNA_END=1249 /DNA_ORIENTATION=+
MAPRTSGACLACLLIVLPLCDGFGLGTPAMGLRSSKAHAGISTRAGRRLTAPQKGVVTMQVWSNEQAIKEYRDLLEGKAPAPTQDGPAVIVGGGKLGNCIKDMGKGEDRIITRGGSIPLELPDVGTEFPVYVCVKEDDVEEVIRSCPKEKVDDLVFMQEGNIELLLKKYGLCGNENTQATINFKVIQMGSRPQNCRVEMEPDSFGNPKYAGETVVCGKWGDALKERLERADIPCEKLYYRDWRRHMFEKVIFDSIFNLVGVLHNEQTLGEVGKFYFGEVDDMLFEINGALRGAFALTMLYGFEDRFYAYSQGYNVEYIRSKVENFKWRNGFIYSMAETARQIGFPDPTPMHTQYLEYAKSQGLINFDFETYKIS